MKLFLALVLAVTGFAETYRFEPTEFYNTFSGAHKPVLQIKPGDTLVVHLLRLETNRATGFSASPIDMTVR